MTLYRHGIRRVEEVDKIVLRSGAQRLDRLWLEPQVMLVILGDLTNEALEGMLGQDVRDSVAPPLMVLNLRDRLELLEGAVDFECKLAVAIGRSFDCALLRVMDATAAKYR